MFLMSLSLNNNNYDDKILNVKKSNRTQLQLIESLIYGDVSNKTGPFMSCLICFLNHAGLLFHDWPKIVQIVSLDT